MSMLIKNKELVEDTWVTLDAEAPLPDNPNQAVIVPLRRWQAERDALSARPGEVGVQLEPTDDVWAAADDLTAAPLVALSFPKFADGRGYSQAYILRTHLGFKGELRAVGDVLRDQIHHMARCGIDAFAIREGKDPRDALKAFEVFSVAYQDTHPRV